MQKPRDWIDYAHLATELGQLSELSAISDKIGAVGRLAATQVENEQRAEWVRAQEDQIREFVFQGVAFIRGLRQKHLQSNPRGTLLLTLGLAEQIKGFDVRTVRVRQYADKESVQRLLDGVSELQADCGQALSIEDRQMVDTCMRFKSENAQLESAIRWARRKQELAEKKVEWTATLEAEQTRLDSVKQHTQPRFHPGLTALALGFGLLLTGYGAQMFVHDGPDYKWIVAFAGAYFLATAFVGLLRVTKKEVLVLKEQIANLTERCSQTVVEREEANFIKQFGEHTVAEYEELLRERQTLIEQVTYGAEQDAVAGRSRPSSAL